MKCYGGSIGSVFSYCIRDSDNEKFIARQYSKLNYSIAADVLLSPFLLSALPTQSLSFLSFVHVIAMRGNSNISVNCSSIIPMCSLRPQSPWRQILDQIIPRLPSRTHGNIPLRLTCFLSGARLRDPPRLEVDIEITLAMRTLPIRDCGVSSRTHRRRLVSFGRRCW